MKKIYSFDVYDTCISRPYERPTDIFFDLARVTLREHGVEITPDEINKLVSCRIQSEDHARRLIVKSEEVKFEQIYAQLAILYTGQIDFIAMLNRELEFERNRIYANALIKNRILQLREAGHEIIFISDMYLPGQFIKSILKDTGIALEKDELYVSSDVGLRKRSGNLYKYVLNKKNLTPEQIFHYGDNYISDYLVPRSIGMMAEHIRMQPDYYLDYKCKTRVKNREDHLISAMRGIHKQLQHEKKTDQILYNNLAPLVSEVIGPLLVSFVSWVLRDAAEKGIKRLYFVSRDGQILYEIARRLITGGVKPQLRYLYGSRHAWNVPSIFTLDESVYCWAFRKNEPMYPLAILKRLGLKDEQAVSILLKNGYSQKDMSEELDKAGIDSFKALLEQADIYSLILANAALSRESTVGYLRQEGLFDDIKWALVDAGWHLSAQNALKKILEAAEYSGQVSGYYLGIRKNHLPVSVAGNYFAFISEFSGNVVTGQKYPAIFEQGAASIIENVFMMADHSQVTGYEKKSAVISPCFAPRTPESLEHQFMLCMREHLVRYIDLVGSSGILEYHFKLFVEFALANTDRFFQSPGETYVKLLSQLPLSNDQTHDPEEVRRLASALKIRDLVDIVSHRVINKHQRYIDKNHGWYAGSATISPIHVKITFFIMSGLFHSMKKYFPNLAGS